MSAGPDWAQKEVALAALLTAGGRTELLAALAEYSTAAVREARALGAMRPRSAICRQALDWLLRPVFICGHHRSGTTLLQNLLDGHPELLSLPSEGTYFSSFAYVGERASDDRLDRFAVEWISRLVDPNFEPHFRLGRSRADRAPAVDFARLLFGWHEALRGSVPRQLAPILALAAAYWATTAPTSAPRAWVEKTPLNERHVRRFAYFDRGCFVHLVRDPRAVLASLTALYGKADLDRFHAADGAFSIGRSLQLAERNGRRLAGRYLVVRYEDLVGDSAAQIERVRQLLRIVPHPALSTPTANGRPVAANSAFAGGSSNVDRARQPPVLPAEQLALLAIHAAAAARPFGYELPSVGWPIRWIGRARYWPRRLLLGARSARRAVALR